VGRRREGGRCCANDEGATFNFELPYLPRRVLITKPSSPFHPHARIIVLPTTTMQSLPLELREAIIAELIPHTADDESAVPRSTAQERQDVYNVRQTCRELKDGASRTFAEIIQDVPSFCSAKSLDHVDQLLQHVPELAEKLVRLTIGSSNLKKRKKERKTEAQLVQGASS
jgi:hypothetical protein